jgi:tetratricopeptide (TPR) repeat protein
LEVAAQPEPVASQLERMLAHPPLVSSPSLSRFLRFIVEETIAGRGESITEFSLGGRVFNRGEEFNPRTDPIVRVQAHNLRARMARYYAGPGAADSLRIELPGRTYVPVFRMLPQPAPPPAELAALPQSPVPTKLRGSVLVTALAAFLSVAGMASLWRTSAPAHGAAILQNPSSAAQDLYIRGRYLMDRQSEPAMRQSIDCFQQAVAIDPQFAAAFAGLADAHNLLAQYGYISPRDGMEQARRAAQRALDIDPALAEAHVSLAAILEAYDWNWPAAEREYRRAIELNPALPAAHLWYGMFLRDQDRLEEALPELRRAEQLEPLSVLASMNLAHAFLMAGDSSAALERALRAVDLDPDLASASLLLATVYRKRSDTSGADAALARARGLSAGNPHAVALLACAYARKGNRQEGLRLYGELQQLASHRYVSPFDLGNLSLVLGDENRAVAQFEEAYRQRSAGMVFLRNERAAWMQHSPRMLSIISKIRAS